MVVKFADIAKGPKDLLNDDYTSTKTLKCKKSAGPVAVTIETDRSDKGALTSKIGTKFSYAGLSFDKIQLKPDGSNVFETSITPCPGCITQFKAAKGADVIVDYTSGAIRWTGTLDVKNMSSFSTSATIAAAGGINVGGDAVYSLSGKGLTSYNVGGNYTSGPFFASAVAASKMSSLNVGLMYSVSPSLTLASQSVHSAASPLDTFTVGGKYNVGPGTDVKAKIGNDGSISACLVKEVAPKVTLTLSGTTSTKDSSKISYGLGISM